MNLRSMLSNASAVKATRCRNEELDMRRLRAYLRDDPLRNFPRKRNGAHHGR
jgi:hypothetical protein